MNKPVIPSLSPELIETLLGLNNNARKIALAVFKEIMITEADLLTVCKIKADAKSLEYPLKKLKQMGIVNRFKDDDHTIWYTVHSKLLMQYMQCQQCNHRKKEVYRSNMNSAHYFSCQSTVLCGYNYYRVAHALLKQFKAANGLTPVADDFRVTRRRTGEVVREYVGKEIEYWSTKDFIELILDSYKQNYPHIETPTKSQISRNFSKVRKAFETEFEDSWRYILKHYIKYNFDKAKEEHYIVSVKRMSEPRMMNEYLEARPFVEEIQECGKYGIKCPYWKEECTLTSRGGMCTKKIRSHMRRKYG
jgi:hypothetical protein